MHFRLIDQVLECDSQRIVAVKCVTAAEEYLQDHFPGFPVLPGVFMIEAMTQAARELLRRKGHGRCVAGRIRGVRYGSFVRPGESLRVEVVLDKEVDRSFEFRGTGTVVRVDGTTDTAVTGRLTLRPVRLAALQRVAG